MIKLIFGLIFSLLFFASCQSKENLNENQTSSATTDVHVPAGLYLKQNINFAPCSLELTCPSGSICAYLDLNTGSEAVCVNPETICNQTGCSEGQCVALRSYPPQIQCMR